jgi:ABC-type glycerol-3-phosphate transport system substrate-binding protein
VLGFFRVIGCPTAGEEATLAQAKREGATRRSFLKALVAGGGVTALSAMMGACTPPRIETAATPVASPSVPAVPSVMPATPAAALPPPTPTLAPRTATPTQTIRIAANHAPVELPWLRKAVEGFTTARPAVGVEIVNTPTGYLGKIAEWAANGSLPDVLYARTGYAAAWAYRGWLRPLEMGPGSSPADEADLPATSIEALKGATGWLYVPTLASVTALYCNPSLFRQAGIQPPYAGMNWNDLLASSRAIAQVTGGRSSRWGLSWHPDHLTMAAIWRGELATAFAVEGLSVDGAECVALTQAIADLGIGDGASAPRESDLSSGAATLVGGTLAAEANGSWAAAQYRATEKQPISIVAPPRGSAGQIAAAPLSAGWGLGRDAKSRPLAADLIRQLGGKDAVDIAVTLPLRDVPARLSSVSLWLEGLKAVGGPGLAETLPGLVQESRSLPLVPWALDFQDAYEDLMPQIWNGKKRASDVLPDLQNRVNAAARRFR